MKIIKALKSFAGAKYSASSGQIITCPEGFAQDMIDAGYAEKVILEKTAKISGTKGKGVQQEGI